MPEHVVVLAPDQAAGASVAAALMPDRHHVVTGSSLQDLSELLNIQMIDAVLFAANDLDRTALQVCHQLRETLGPQAVIMVVCTSCPGWARVVALEVGADDIITSSVVADELRARLAAHLRRRHMFGGS